MGMPSLPTARPLKLPTSLHPPLHFPPLTNRRVRSPILDQFMYLHFGMHPFCLPLNVSLSSTITSQLPLRFLVSPSPLLQLGFFIHRNAQVSLSILKTICRPSSPSGSHLTLTSPSKPGFSVERSGLIGPMLPSASLTLSNWLSAHRPTEVVLVSHYDQRTLGQIQLPFSLFTLIDLLGIFSVTSHPLTLETPFP